MGKRSFDAKSEKLQSGISSNTLYATSNSEVKEDISVPIGNNDEMYTNVASEPIKEALLTPESVNEAEVCIQKLDSGIAVNSSGVEEEKVNGESGSVFCYGEKEKERFNRILNYYKGRHNFHNFTTRTKAEDPAAQRYIISFNADTTITIEGIEFVKCEVVGQSFMLHQIKKMMGVAVAIMRNTAPESLIEFALQKDVNINVPTAPEVGLYLDECFFTAYNQKFKDSHEEVSMKAYREEAEEFKLKHIYTHIGSTEHKEGSVGLWLHSLNYRNYPDLRCPGNGDKVEAKTLPVVNIADTAEKQDVPSATD